MVFFFLYCYTRKVSPSAIRGIHVNNWLLWKLQSWKFTASVLVGFFLFCFGFFVCFLKWFSILWKFLSVKSQAALLVFDFQRHLELFRVSVLQLTFLSWMNNMQFNQGWSCMDINLKLEHTTVFMAFIQNSLESVEVSSLASVGFSSNLLRILYKTPPQGASFVICGTWGKVTVRKKTVLKPKASRNQRSWKAQRLFKYYATVLYV